MSDFTSPLRKIVRREGTHEVLECGHEQEVKPNKAKRRRCIQCRRSKVTISETREAAEGARCPYCFDEWVDTPDEPTHTCDRCKAKLHDECWQENGGCTVLGCRGNQSRMVIRPRVAQTTPSAPQIVRPAVARLSMRTRVAGFLDVAGFPLAMASWLFWNFWVAVLVYVAVFTLRWIINGRR